MTARVPLVAGNWKMHKTVSAARTLLQGLRAELGSAGAVDVAVAPPFTALAAAAEVLAGSRIALGAQDMHEAEEGAYTGEISATMLSDVGCSFVVLGHSERRALFGEADATVARKVRAALAHDLVPYLCCGESLAEREADRTQAVVERQLRAVLESLDARDAGRVVIAYEPVWAIGTGETATPSQAQEVHAFVRALVAEIHGSDVAQHCRILYGGSVKPDNAAELIGQPDVDGALVGGASLGVASFAGIVRAVG